MSAVCFCGRQDCPGVEFDERACYYPLVTALDAAGFEGDGYELAAKNLGTLIEQTKAAESALAAEKAQLAATREALERAKRIADCMPRFFDEFRPIHEGIIAALSASAPTEPRADLMRVADAAWLMGYEWFWSNRGHPNRDEAKRADCAAIITEVTK